LSFVVKIRLLQALEATRAGLATVAASQKYSDLTMQVQLPGNTASLIGDTERELNSLKDTIDKLLLPNEQIAFGGESRSKIWLGDAEQR
jgi:hypothetical protein